MATNIKITSVKQLQPVSAPAQVQIDFIVLGILPDIVQIYAGGVSNQVGGFVDKVDINSPENTYTTIITLAAGTAFFLSLCPRTLTNGILDDQMDEKDWQTFCSMVPFTTQAPEPPTHPRQPIPAIGSIEPHQPTLRNPGKIDVHWTATANFDLFHFMWMEQPHGWNQVEINSGGRSGVFTVSPATPGRTYEFKVQGCVSKLIGQDDCSFFSDPTTFVMPAATRSLREFLRLSNVPLNSGIRSLGRDLFGAGVRAMMHL
jgi:hypothetical protein